LSNLSCNIFLSLKTFQSFNYKKINFLNFNLYSFLGHFKDDKKNGSGLYLLKNGNILVGNFIEGEIEGLSLIFPLKGAKQMCFMSQSKPKILISDENEKNNIRLSMEYKELMDFYERNQNIIKSFYSE
jgi:hypothetical protein